MAEDEIEDTYLIGLFQGYGLNENGKYFKVNYSFPIWAENERENDQVEANYFLSIQRKWGHLCRRRKTFEEI